MADHNAQQTGPSGVSSAGANPDAPIKNVEGKVAFVTGGDSGIGLGIARAFANAGMKIVITYRSQNHLDQAMHALEGAGKRIHTVNVDVTDRAAMAVAAEEAVRVFGKVHVLVNNAGVIPIVSLSSASFDDYEWCMRINVGGVFNGIRTFLPHIKSHGEGGHIVSTASIDGLVIGRLSMGLYAASKFAVVGMMEALRSELSGTGVGASVFCPGGVNTNIANCQRNRPAELAARGAFDASEIEARKEFSGAVRQVIEKNAGAQIQMDPLEAGEKVLQGIRNNDLYILSHPEFKQALCDRADALLASIPDGASLPEARVAIAGIMRNPTYGAELSRKRAAVHRSMAI